MTIYYYSIDGEDERSPVEAESTHPSDIAEAAAEVYHQNGGWEVTWPVDIAIYDDGGVLLGAYSVEREAVPVFSATQKRRHED